VKPSVGRIVIYRNRAGVDMPAIITALAEEEGFVHLHPFPPPGAAPDRQMGGDWGVEHFDVELYTGVEAAEISARQARGRWRWPERVK